MTVSLLVAALVACKQQDEPSPPPPKGGPPPLAEKEHYRLDVGPQTPCTVGAPCQVQLVLTALGDYHVNEKFPTKFVLDRTNRNITAASEGGFALETAKAGVWTLPYRASTAGKQTFKGKFRLGVCTGNRCEMDSPEIAFDVTVR